MHDSIAAHSAAALDGSVPEAVEALLAALQVGGIRVGEGDVVV